MQVGQEHCSSGSGICNEVSGRDLKACSHAEEEAAVGDRFWGSRERSKLTIIFQLKGNIDMFAEVRLGIHAEKVLA